MNCVQTDINKCRNIPAKRGQKPSQMGEVHWGGEGLHWTKNKNKNKEKKKKGQEEAAGMA